MGKWRWLLLSVLVASPLFASDLEAYVVLHTDESRLILENADGVKVVSARTYCWEYDGFAAGDVVLATDHLDTCVATMLISRRGKVCGVWCP